MQVPETLEEFLKQAGEKLKIKSTKAFSESGAVVDDISVIRDDEKIYISGGEPFFKLDTTRVRTYKVAVLGSGGVGKSCLSLRYVKSTFVDIYDPTIEDAFRHQTVIDGVTCILDILDTAGQEDMQMLRRQWIEDRDGFLLVFSIVDHTTFDDLQSFYDLISQVKEEQIERGVPLVVVGNKGDLEESRKVSKEESLEWATKCKASYVETSAKTGLRVNDAFEELVRNFIKLEPDVPEPTKKKKGLCVLL